MTKQKRSVNSRNRASMIVHGISVRVPKEIAIEGLSSEAEIRAVAEKIIQGASRRSREIIDERSAHAAQPETWFKPLASIATNAWRAKIRMVDPNTGEANEEMKRVYRHIENIFDALKQIGVETIDPTGKVFDSGMALKVISFEETPGLSKEEIKETIKPTVLCQGRLIQMGEVIVGSPKADTSPKEERT